MIKFEDKVWTTLSNMELDQYVSQIPATGKRPPVNYLSWSNAWALTKSAFPGTTYAHRADLHHPDGTVEVEVDVVIAEGDGDKVFTNARLAIMDMKFNAIQNPNARQINDGRQRALVKALAFAGLGLNLWGDSNIPIGRQIEPITENEVVELTQLMARTDTHLDVVLEWAGVEELDAMDYEKYMFMKKRLSKKVKELEAETE